MTDPINLSPELQEIAYQQLGRNEAPELRLSALTDLWTRIEALPLEQRLQDLSDANLIRFLRGRKYDLERALQTTIAWHWFQIDNIDEEIAHWKDYLQVIENPTGEGGVIIIMLPKKTIGLFTPDYQHRYPNAMIKFNIWLFESITHNLYAQLGGIHIITSFHEFTLWDNLKMSTMAPVRHHLALFHYAMNCVGMRLKSVTIFEEPAFFSMIWSMTRIFLPQKMKERFHFCGSHFERLFEIVEHLQPEVIPAIVGGKGSEEAAAAWIQQEIAFAKQQEVKKLSNL